MDQISDISDCIELSLSALGACLAKQPDGEGSSAGRDFCSAPKIPLGKITHDCRIEKSIEESKITEQLPTHKIVQNSPEHLEHLALFKQSLLRSLCSETKAKLWHSHEMLHVACVNGNFSQ